MNKQNDKTINLLILSNNPNRASFRQRIGIYLDKLAENHINCKVVKLPKNYIARWGLFRCSRAFDAVYLHKKCLNVIDSHLLRKYAKKVIYDFDDAVMFSPKNPQNNKSSHFRLFRRTAKLADFIIAGNSYLAEHAKKFNDSVKIIPTGLNFAEYNVSVQKPDDNKVRLVWIGSKSTLKYLADIKPVLENIGSRCKNVVLRIVCDAFFNLENMEVEKCKWSLDEQAEKLVTSDIALAPLSDNRFTRGKCGFKILQYAAAALPVVTSPIGVNSELVKDGITGFWATDDQQWIKKLISLIENKQLRTEMGKKNQTLAKKYDTSVIGTNVILTIKEILNEADGAFDKN